MMLTHKWNVYTHTHFKQMYTTLSGMAVFLSLGTPTELALQTANIAKPTGNTFHFVDYQ